MGQKKITDLTLRSAVVETVQFPIDDGTQTYRVTALQLRKYLSTSRTITASGTIATDDIIVLVDPTSAGWTQALPACASYPAGCILTIKNIATNGNIVTLDGNASEFIDSALTLDLGSDQVMESVQLYNTGTKWLIL
jgi:hypothetical protein